MLSTMTDKGQITLPKPIRDQLGIVPGSKLSFEVQPDNSLRVRVLARGSRGLFGLLAVSGENPRTLEEMDAGVTQAVAARAKPRR